MIYDFHAAVIISLPTFSQCEEKGYEKLKLIMENPKGWETNIPEKGFLLHGLR